jgi:hypothetical protein
MTVGGFIGILVIGLIVGLLAASSRRAPTRAASSVTIVKRHRPRRSSPR